MTSTIMIVSTFILLAGPLVLLCDARPQEDLKMDSSTVVDVPGISSSSTLAYNYDDPRTWTKAAEANRAQLRALKARLLGVSMVNQDSNTTPKYEFSPLPLPDPKTQEQCQSEWQAYFNKKKGSSAELSCCVGLKNCECLKKVCQGKENTKECQGISECRSADCKQGNWTVQQCLALPNAPARHSSMWNWLWILIVIAAIMIILICVAICCVYSKKFSGKHDSKKDKRKAHISFGPMNVDSKVHWSGKRKGSRKGSKASRKGSKKSGKQSRTKQSTKQTTRKVSGSKGNSAPKLG